jgi:hypothetical protein
VLLRHLLTNISKLPKIIKKHHVVLRLSSTSTHVRKPCRIRAVMIDLPPGQLPAPVFPLPLLLHQGSYARPISLLHDRHGDQLRVPLQHRVWQPPAKQGLSPHTSFTCLHNMWPGPHHHHNSNRGHQPSSWSISIANHRAHGNHITEGRTSSSPDSGKLEAEAERHGHHAYRVVKARGHQARWGAQEAPASQGTAAPPSTHCIASPQEGLQTYMF